jgi:twitching motility two-component system response regulator PilH
VLLGVHMQPDGAELRQMVRKHILIVNREPEFLALMRELLHTRRYNVTTTNFVPRTFEQIAASQPDLVIVDLSLREEAPWNLLERLHQAATTEDLPVIVVSTSPDLIEQVLEENGRFGADRFLLRPFEVPDLLETIEELIGTD